MNNLKSFTSVLSGLILGICLPVTAQAGMVNGSHWLVKSGDSVYSIARQVFPGNSKQQARLRQELVSSNPQVFKGNPNTLSVGAKLRLPAFATTKATAPQVAKTPKAIRLPQPRPKQQAAPVRVARAAVTPDPADSIGKVIINMGELSAVNRGSVRKLSRNSSVLKGDTLKTANNSHTQIRLKDGALISLRPNTEFRIADFRYNGSEDGTERGLFELIKGGFRTITGAIGHRNKQNYRVNTTVATIGIRGTHYGLVLCTDGSCESDGSNLADGLYGGVVDGAVVATNTTGEFNFTNDEYFVITSQTSTPTPILKPTLVFDGVSSDTELATSDGSSSDAIATDSTVTSTSSVEIASIPGVELVDSATSSVVNQPLAGPDDPNKAPSGSAMMIAFNYTDLANGGTNGVGAPVYVTDSNNNAIYMETLASGETVPVLAYEETLDGTTHSLVIGTAVPSSLGSTSSITAITPILPSDGTPVDVNVNWGRWEGNFTVAENGIPLANSQYLHFIYSDSVLDTAALANLGGLGANVSYNSINGTIPTDNTGTEVGTTFATINMSVDFSSAEITSYDVTVTEAAVPQYQGSTTGVIAFEDLNNSFTISGTSGAACTGGGCTGEASVAFIGSQAEGAISSYSLTSIDGSSSVSGASLLQR